MDLSGELGFASMPALLQRIDEILDGGTVDLSRVTRADSAGVAFLLELTRRARKSGRELKFTGAGSELRSLIEFLEIDGVLKLA